MILNWIKEKLRNPQPSFYLTTRHALNDPIILSSLSEDFLIYLTFKEGIIMQSVHASAQELLEQITSDDYGRGLEWYYAKGLNELLDSGFIKIKLTRKGKKSIKDANRK